MANSMVRVVLDTNILISGLLYLGKPKKLLDFALKGRMDIVSSIGMVDEFKRVISREKFKLSVPEQEVLTTFIIRLSHMTSVKSGFKVVKDKDDDLVVNTAFDGKAAYIVSGDHHLLELKEFGRIKIVTASEMLEFIERGMD